MLRRRFLENTLASSIGLFVAPRPLLFPQSVVKRRLKEKPSEWVAGFLHPPDSVKPTTLWQWMNGCVTKEGITYDLESFKLPELWHADTGVIETAPQWRQRLQRTEVTLNLGPSGSVFVLFQKPADGFDSVVAMRHNGKLLSRQESATWRVVDSVYQLTTTQAGTFVASMASGEITKLIIQHVPKPVQLTGLWKLRFPPNWGAPEFVTLPSLISWAEHPDKGVKYFSGTATYQHSFTIPISLVGKPYKMLLDLGTVKHIASVSLNGRLLGTLWKPPFRIEVTSALQVGVNKLEIKVTNLWPNRMIGDEQEPDDNEWGPVRTFTYVNPPVPIGRNLQRAPSWLTKSTPRPSTGRYSYTTMDVFNADSPLLTSGLLGPVRLDIAVGREFVS